jgi:hypothetical protein
VLEEVASFDVRDSSCDGSVALGRAGLVFATAHRTPCSFKRGAKSEVDNSRLLRPP